GFINGAVTLSGWAIDPDANVGLRIEIRVDGRLTGAITANRDRPDVAAAYPAFGPNHGYYSRFYMTDGAHNVCIVGINVGAGANTSYMCRRLVINNNPFGAITAVQLSPGGVQILGWAIDPNQTAATQVSIYADGRPLMRIPANTDVP